MALSNPTAAAKATTEFVTNIWPQIEHDFGSGGALVDVQHNDLDHSGIDYLHFSDNGIRALAIRVRFGRYYPDFTFRAHCAQAELGTYMSDKHPRPSVVLCAFVGQFMTHVHAASGKAVTEALRKYHDTLLDKTNKQDGYTFKVLPLKLVEEFGPVRLWHLS